MSDNLRIYNQVRETPENAKKQIQAGDLKGFTDINPMYRIKKLTEVFGPCGIGWKYSIDKQWSETCSDGTTSAYCNITLYYKDGDVWSDGVPGTGGANLLMNTRNGLKANDEGYKKALTDAISVAAKAIGVGADVYWEKGESKYTNIPPEPVRDAPSKPAPSSPVTVTSRPADEVRFICERCNQPIPDTANMTNKQVAEYTFRKCGKVLCETCYKALLEEQKHAK